MCRVNAAADKYRELEMSTPRYLPCKKESSNSTDTMPTTEGKLEHKFQHRVGSHTTWASTTRLCSALSCRCSTPTSLCSLAATSSCVNMSNSHAAQVVFSMQQVERLSQSAATADTLYNGLQNAGCRTIPKMYMHTGNKHVQALETVVSLVYMCMQRDLYLCSCRAGANLSPRHLVLQAGNLLLQITDCPLLLCCLCTQLRLHCELTSSNNSIKQAKLQRPLAVSKHPCKTISVMLLQYIHGKTHKGTL